ncbi:ATP-binding cassette domain-containing protein, partial [Staphylococcus aureus]
SGVSISFEQVNFSYSNTKGILQGINLQIKPGEKICIMGKSGAGKSSMLRLLTGAFKQFEGTILIDNMPIGNYTLNSIRSQT